MRWLCVLGALVVLAGCQEQAARGPRAMTGPLWPMERGMGVALATAMGACERGEGGKGGPADLLVSYVQGGRDFAGEEGTDGYVLRVIPLSKSYSPIELEGNMVVALYEQGGERPVRVWQMGGERLAGCWMETTMLPGYVLALHWGEVSPGPGHYLFRMWYVGTEAEGAMCREISFTDATGASDN